MTKVLRASLKVARKELAQVVAQGREHMLLHLWANSDLSEQRRAKENSQHLAFR
jgi:hypothetical protein